MEPGPEADHRLIFRTWLLTQFWRAFSAGVGEKGHVEDKENLGLKPTERYHVMGGGWSAWLWFRLLRSNWVNTGPLSTLPGDIPHSYLMNTNGNVGMFTSGRLHLSVDGRKNCVDVMRSVFSNILPKKPSWLENADSHFDVTGKSTENHRNLLTLDSRSLAGI